MRNGSGPDHEPIGGERLPRNVDTFAVLDLDRTLLNTGTLVDLMCMQLLHHGVTMDQIKKDIDFVHRSDGLSFSMLDFIEAQYGPARYTAVMHEIEAQVKDGLLTDQLLCRGTNEMLTALEANDIPYAVLTYGEPVNQQFKLTLLRHMVRRSEARLHAAVTDKTKKAAWISGDEWAAEGAEGFAVPASIFPQAALHARYVVVVDDKPSNLESDNAAVMGILVDNGPDDGALTTADVARLLNAGTALTAIAEASSVARAAHIDI